MLKLFRNGSYYYSQLCLQGRFTLEVESISLIIELWKETGFKEGKVHTSSHREIESSSPDPSHSAACPAPTPTFSKLLTRCDVEVDRAAGKRLKAR